MEQLGHFSLALQLRFFLLQVLFTYITNVNRYVLSAFRVRFYIVMNSILTDFEEKNWAGRKNRKQFSAQYIFLLQWLNFKVILIALRCRDMQYLTSIPMHHSLVSAYQVPLEMKNSIIFKQKKLVQFMSK